MTPLLEVKDLTKTYRLKKWLHTEKKLRALRGVSLSLRAGETLSLVGESGCGKSTFAKVLMGIEPETSGKIFWNAKPTESYSIHERQAFAQMIFQDPYGSLNPRKKIWQIIAEPAVVNFKGKLTHHKELALEKMRLVGLREEWADRYPHMFSGGQRQRIGIARALVLDPKVLICDEPVSALDVSVQAQVLNLLLQLQKDLNLSLLFISHDLSVVKHISDHIAVMYLGKIAETGTANDIFERPMHPYTKALLAATPKLKRDSQPRVELKGEIPSPLDPPGGCAFHTRCPFAEERCRLTVPDLRTHQTHEVACHLVEY